MEKLLYSIIGFLSVNVMCQSQSLSIPDVSGPSGGTASIAVQASSLSKLSAADLEIKFDPNVLSLKDAKMGDISNGGLIESNEIVPGVVLVSLVDGGSIYDDGQLINLVMNVKGASGQSTDLKITGKAYNSDLVDIMVDFTPGKFTVTGGSGWMKYLIYGLLALLLLSLIFWLIGRNKKKKEAEEKARQTRLEKRRQDRMQAEVEPESQKQTVHKATYVETTTTASEPTEISDEEAELREKLRKIQEKKQLDAEEAELERKLKELRDKKGKD